MEEISDLKKKINRIEYEEIKELKEDISNIKIDLATNNLLTKQSIESTNKLSSTLDTVTTTMIHLSSGIEQSNKVCLGLNDKVDNLESKFDTLESKTKFDFVLWFKEHLIEIVMGSCFIVYIMSTK